MRIAGYIGFGLFSLFVSLYLTRPDEVIGERLIYEVRKETKGKVDLAFDRFELDGLAGMDVRGLRASLGDGEKVTVEFDRVEGGLSILSMLMFTPRIVARVESGEGAVELDLMPGEERRVLNLSFDAFNFGDVPGFSEFVGFPVNAVVDGGVDSDWVGGIQSINGNVNLRLRDVKIGPGNIKGVEVPVISLGNLELELEGQNGRVSIVSFAQEGGDVKASLSGDIGIRSRFGGSSLNLCAKLKVNEEFLGKNEKMRSALELAAIQLKKDSEDFLHLPLTGRFDRPRLRGGLCRASDGSKKRSARK